MLNDIFQCKTPFVTKYVEEVSNDGYYEDVINYQLLMTACKEIGICQWFMNTKMCQGPLCPHGVYDKTIPMDPQCKQQCTPPHRKWAL